MNPVYGFGQEWGCRQYLHPGANDSGREPEWWDSVSSNDLINGFLSQKIAGSLHEKAMRGGSHHS